MRVQLAVLVAGVCGGLGSSAWAQAPQRGNNDPASITAPSRPVDPDRHIEAVGQGAQDPARSEILEGRSRDMRKCMATLTARRESDQEAREVCNKILSGLGE